MSDGICIRRQVIWNVCGVVRKKGEYYGRGGRPAVESSTELQLTLRKSEKD